MRSWIGSYQIVWQNGNHSGEKLYGMWQKMDYLYYGTHVDISQAIYFFMQMLSLSCN